MYSKEIPIISCMTLGLKHQYYTSTHAFISFSLFCCSSDFSDLRSLITNWSSATVCWSTWLAFNSDCNCDVVSCSCIATMSQMATCLSNDWLDLVYHLVAPSAVKPVSSLTSSLKFPTSKGQPCKVVYQMIYTSNTPHFQKYYWCMHS